jgi:hypothetical protein
MTAHQTVMGWLSGLGLSHLLGAVHEDEAESDEKGSGDDEPPAWVPVATPGTAIEARLIVGWLESEGLPARISQEAAGAALGLTVGLGRIHILVPAPLEERALALLAMSVEVEIDEQAD